MSFEYIKHLLIRTFTTISDNIFVKSAIGVWLYFSGIHVYFYCIGALVIFDVITGIYASIKQGRKFTSEYLRKGLLEKVALYLILLLSAFAFETVFKTMYNWEHFFAVFFVTVLVTSYEMVSICENIIAVNPKFLFLNSIINLSKKISDKTVKNVEDKIDMIIENKDCITQKENDQP